MLVTRLSRERVCPTETHGSGCNTFECNLRDLNLTQLLPLQARSLQHPHHCIRKDQEDDNSPHITDDYGWRPKPHRIEEYWALKYSRACWACSHHHSRQKEWDDSFLSLVTHNGDQIFTAFRETKCGAWALKYNLTVIQLPLFLYNLWSTHKNVHNTL